MVERNGGLGFSISRSIAMSWSRVHVSGSVASAVRPSPRSRMRKVFTSWAMVMSFLIVAPSAALDRFFPPNASRGELNAHQYPLYRIGDRSYRMSPGGRIFSQQNLIIMPASLQQQTAQIMYAVDINGQLSAIWLLTPEEAKKYPLSKLDAEEKKKREDEERKKREEEEKKKKDAAGSNR
jgi:hypothetical protein